jgi:hypothetical protein
VTLLPIEPRSLVIALGVTYLHACLPRAHDLR